MSDDSPRNEQYDLLVARMAEAMMLNAMGMSEDEIIAMTEAVIADDLKSGITYQFGPDY